VPITEELIFHHSMTRDFKSLQDLEIFQARISCLDEAPLKALVSLRRLSLSFNLISKIEGLDALKELKELNLSFNRIAKIDNLRLANLRVLNLD